MLPGYPTQGQMHMYPAPGVHGAPGGAAAGHQGGLHAGAGGWQPMGHQPLQQQQWGAPAQQPYFAPPLQAQPQQQQHPGWWDPAVGGAGGGGGAAQGAPPVAAPLAWSTGGEPEGAQQQQQTWWQHMGSYAPTPDGALPGQLSQSSPWGVDHFQQQPPLQQQQPQGLVPQHTASAPYAAPHARHQQQHQLQQQQPQQQQQQHLPYGLMLQQQLLPQQGQSYSAPALQQFAQAAGLPTAAAAHATASLWTPGASQPGQPWPGQSLQSQPAAWHPELPLNTDEPTSGPSAAARGGRPLPHPVRGCAAPGRGAGAGRGGQTGRKEGSRARGAAASWRWESEPAGGGGSAVGPATATSTKRAWARGGAAAAQLPMPFAAPGAAAQAATPAGGAPVGDVGGAGAPLDEEAPEEDRVPSESSESGEEDEEARRPPTPPPRPVEWQWGEAAVSESLGVAGAALRRNDVYGPRVLRRQEHRCPASAVAACGAAAVVAVVVSYSEEGGEDPDEQDTSVDAIWRPLKSWVDAISLRRVLMVYRSQRESHDLVHSARAWHSAHQLPFHAITSSSQLEDLDVPDVVVTKDRGGSVLGSLRLVESAWEHLLFTTGGTALLDCAALGVRELEALNSLFDENEARFQGRRVADVAVIALLPVQRIEEEALTPPFYDRFRALCRPTPALLHAPQGNSTGVIKITPSVVRDEGGGAVSLALPGGTIRLQEETQVVDLQLRTDWESQLLGTFRLDEVGTPRAVPGLLMKCRDARGTVSCDVLIRNPPEDMPGAVAAMLHAGFFEFNGIRVPLSGARIFVCRGYGPDDAQRVLNSKFIYAAQPLRQPLPRGVAVANHAVVHQLAAGAKAKGGRMVAAPGILNDKVRALLVSGALHESEWLALLQHPEPLTILTAPNTMLPSSLRDVFGASMLPQLGPRGPPPCALALQLRAASGRPPLSAAHIAEAAVDSRVIVAASRDVDCLADELAAVCRSSERPAEFAVLCVGPHHDASLLETMAVTRELSGPAEEREARYYSQAGCLAELVTAPVPEGSRRIVLVLGLETNGNLQRHLESMCCGSPSPYVVVNATRRRVPRGVGVVFAISLSRVGSFSLAHPCVPHHVTEADMVAAAVAGEPGCPPELSRAATTLFAALPTAVRALSGVGGFPSYPCLRAVVRGAAAALRDGEQVGDALFDAVDAVMLPRWHPWPEHCAFLRVWVRTMLAQFAPPQGQPAAGRHGVGFESALFSERLAEVTSSNAVWEMAWRLADCFTARAILVVLTDSVGDPEHLRPDALRHSTCGFIALLLRAMQTVSWASGLRSMRTFYADMLRACTGERQLPQVPALQPIDVPRASGDLGGLLRRFGGVVLCGRGATERLPKLLGEQPLRDCTVHRVGMHPMSEMRDVVGERGLDGYHTMFAPGPAARALCAPSDSGPRLLLVDDPTSAPADFWSFMRGLGCGGKSQLLIDGALAPADSPGSGRSYVIFCAEDAPTAPELAQCPWLSTFPVVRVRPPDPSDQVRLLQRLLRELVPACPESVAEEAVAMHRTLAGTFPARGYGDADLHEVAHHVAMEVHLASRAYASQLKQHQRSARNPMQRFGDAFINLDNMRYLVYQTVIGICAAHLSVAEREALDLCFRPPLHDLPAIDMCGICHDRGELGDRWFVLNCAHMYHERCLNDWRRSKPHDVVTCPGCRSPIQLGSAVLKNGYPFSKHVDLGIDQLETFGGNRKPIPFVLTEQTHPVARSLIATLGLRELRMEGVIPSQGPRKMGMIVEGPSGRGKDFLLETVLLWRGYEEASDVNTLGRMGNRAQKCFHHTTAGIGVGYTAVAEAIRQCMAHGALLIVSEINLLDTHFVQGLLAPQADRPVHPGFFLFATVNPSDTTKGRRTFSSAFLARFLYERVPEWSAPELEQVLRRKSPDAQYARVVIEPGRVKPVIDVLVSFHLSLVSVMTDRKLTTTPTLRRILAAVEMLNCKPGRSYQRKVLVPILRNLYALQFQITHLSARQLLQSAGSAGSGFTAPPTDGAAVDDPQAADERRRLHYRVSLIVQMVANLCMPFRQAPRVTLYRRGEPPPAQDSVGWHIAVPTESNRVDEKELATRLAQMAFTRVGPLGLWSGIGNRVHDTDLARLLESLRVRRCCAKLLPRFSTRIVAPTVQPPESRQDLAAIVHPPPSMMADGAGADMDRVIWSVFDLSEVMRRTAPMRNSASGQVYPVITFLLAELCEAPDLNGMIKHMRALLESIVLVHPDFVLTKALSFLFGVALPYTAELPRSCAEVDIIAASYAAAQLLPGIMSQLLQAMYEEEAGARMETWCQETERIQATATNTMGALAEREHLQQEHEQMVQGVRAEYWRTAPAHFIEQERLHRAGIDDEWARTRAELLPEDVHFHTLLGVTEVSEGHRRSDVARAEDAERQLLWCALSEISDRMLILQDEHQAVRGIQGLFDYGLREVARSDGAGDGRATCPNCRDTFPSALLPAHFDICVPDAKRVDMAIRLQGWWRRMLRQLHPEDEEGESRAGSDYSSAGSSEPGQLAAALVPSAPADPDAAQRPRLVAAEAAAPPAGMARLTHQADTEGPARQVLWRIFSFCDQRTRNTAREVCSQWCRTIDATPVPGPGPGVDTPGRQQQPHDNIAHDLIGAESESGDGSSDVSINADMAIAHMHDDPTAPPPQPAQPSPARFQGLTASDFYNSQPGEPSGMRDMSHPPMIHPPGDTLRSRSDYDASYERWDPRYSMWESSQRETGEFFTTTICDTMLSGGKFVTHTIQQSWLCADSSYERGDEADEVQVVRVKQWHLDVSTDPRANKTYTTIASMFACRVTSCELSVALGESALHVAVMSLGFTMEQTTGLIHNYGPTEAFEQGCRSRAVPPQGMCAAFCKALGSVGVARSAAMSMFERQLRLSEALVESGIDPTAKKPWTVSLDDLVRTRDGRCLVAIPNELCQLWNGDVREPRSCRINYVISRRVPRAVQGAQPKDADKRSGQRRALSHQVYDSSSVPNPDSEGNAANSAVVTDRLLTVDEVWRVCSLYSKIYTDQAAVVGQTIEHFVSSGRMPRRGALALPDCRRLAYLRGPAVGLAAFRSWFASAWARGPMTEDIARWLHDRSDNTDILTFILRRQNRHAPEDMLVRMAAMLLRWVLGPGCPVLVVFGWSCSEAHNANYVTGGSRNIKFQMWNSCALLVMHGRRWHLLPSSTLTGKQPFQLPDPGPRSSLPELGTKIMDATAESSEKGLGTLKWDTLAGLQEWIWESLRQGLRDELFDEHAAFITRFGRTHGRVNLRRLAAGRLDFFELTVLSSSGVHSSRPLVLLGYPPRPRRLCAVELDFWRLLLEAGFTIWAMGSGAPSRIRTLAQLRNFAVKAPEAAEAQPNAAGTEEQGAEEDRLRALREAGIAPESAVMLDAHRLGLLLFRVADAYCSVLNSRLPGPSELQRQLDRAIYAQGMMPRHIEETTGVSALEAVQTVMRQDEHGGARDVEVELAPRTETWLGDALGALAAEPRAAAWTIAFSPGNRRTQSHLVLRALKATLLHPARALRHLHLCRLEFHPTALSSLLSRLPVLERLELTAVHFAAGGLRTATAAESGSRGPEAGADFAPCTWLSELILRDCQGLQYINLISNHRLRVLCLSGCDGIQTLDLASQANLEQFDAFHSSVEESRWRELKQVYLPSLKGLKEPARRGIGNLLNRATALERVVCWSALDRGEVDEVRRSRARPAVWQVGVATEEQRAGRSCWDDTAQGIAACCSYAEMVGEMNLSLRMLCRNFLESLPCSTVPDLRAAVSAACHMFRGMHPKSPLMSPEVVTALQQWILDLLMLSTEQEDVVGELSEESRADLRRMLPASSAIAYPDPALVADLAGDRMPHQIVPLLCRHCVKVFRPYVRSGVTVVSDAMRAAAGHFFRRHAVVTLGLREAQMIDAIVYPSELLEILMDLRYDYDDPDVLQLLSLLRCAEDYTNRFRRYVPGHQTALQAAGPGAGAA
eukprot:TRINITY_DN11286_c0_g1_i1.p1 TRINITY_DN11286_c0_g1~~TRINITY_DN11286_c0_g1_i1.p1  ORF type:complete len:3962 (+),score=1284.72 TRINITY_DN11286_c0_g1_i1:115-12000(+)